MKPLLTLLALPVLALASGTSAAGVTLPNRSWYALGVLAGIVSLLFVVEQIKSRKVRTLLAIAFIVGTLAMSVPRAEALAGGGPCKACENTGVPEEVKVVGGMLIFWIVGLSAIGF